MRARVIGHFRPTPLAIVCECERSGVWKACCKELGLCALGRTPKEAGLALAGFITERGMGGNGSLNGKVCDELRQLGAQKDRRERETPNERLHP